MARRTFEYEGQEWSVSLSGRTSTYGRDQVSIVFSLGSGKNAERRACRFRPLGIQRTVAALAELSDAQLRELLRSSQPAWTSPELGYGKQSLA